MLIVPKFVCYAQPASSDARAPIRRSSAPRGGADARDKNGSPLQCGCHLPPPFMAVFIIPKARPKRESNLLKPGCLGGGAADQGAANAVFSMRGISPSGWIGQQGQGWRRICRGEAGASEMRPYQDDMVDLHPALSSPSATPLRSGGYAGEVKRADGTSASAETTKKNAPYGR